MRHPLTGILSAVLCIAPLVLPAQVVVHRTYDDWLNKRGENVGQFVELVNTMGAYHLVLHRDGLRHKVRCKEVWGFTYNEELFRIFEEGHVPLRLMYQGSICYYENGFAHLTMQRDRVEEAVAEVGDRSYVSKDLQGPIVPAHFPEGDVRSTSARFRREHPAYEPLFRCIGGHDDLDRTRQCVVDYEVMVEGDR